MYEIPKRTLVVRIVRDKQKAKTSYSYIVERKWLEKKGKNQEGDHLYAALIQLFSSLLLSSRSARWLSLFMWTCGAAASCWSCELKRAVVLGNNVGGSCGFASAVLCGWSRRGSGEERFIGRIRTRGTKKRTQLRAFCIPRKKKNILDLRWLAMNRSRPLSRRPRSIQRIVREASVRQRQDGWWAFKNQDCRWQQKTMHVKSFTLQF